MSWRLPLEVRKDVGPGTGGDQRQPEQPRFWACQNEGGYSLHDSIEGCLALERLAEKAFFEHRRDSRRYAAADEHPACAAHDEHQIARDASEKPREQGECLNTDFVHSGHAEPNDLVGSLQ